MKSILVLMLLLNPLITNHACGAASESSGASSPGNSSAKEKSPTQRKENRMKGSHVHLGVRDLPGALQWLEKVWQLRPGYHNERMAIIPFGDLSIILDASTNDTPATVGFDSQNCDEDFRAVKSRGGVVLEEAKDRPWGVRSAYIQGPGALKFEIEQMLPRSK